MKKLLCAWLMVWVGAVGCGHEPAVPPTAESCGWAVAQVDTQSSLGPSDWDAGYNGVMAPVKPGHRAVIRGRFPRARYAAFAVYDQDFMLVDSIEAADLRPLSGENPFRAGVARAGQLPEFSLTVSMDRKPANPPANTLYAGATLRGKPNHYAVITWRVYLPDRGLGRRDGHPLAAFGGEQPPAVKFLDAAGQEYCPRPLEQRLGRSRIMASALRSNLSKITRPDMAGQAFSPPRWINNAAGGDQDESSYVPNPFAAYTVAAVSDAFGPLLVLRWKPARTPGETYEGRPFPDSYDLRYWSICFVYFQPGKNFGYLTEKSLADIDLPLLPDGSAQLVVGFGGAARPEFVPPEQWVGLRMKKGLLLIRNTLAQPGFAGDFFKLPAGPVAPEYDRFTPGGVYGTAEELRRDPDLGLRRAELLRQAR